MTTNSAREWAKTAEAHDLAIQFTRIDRLLDGTPGAKGLDSSQQAAILGVDESRFTRRRTALADNARDVAKRLDPTVLKEVRHHWLGRTLACYGDSITADHQSWAEILAAALAPDVRVINFARSGDTTADLISRFHTTIASTDADAVIVMVGTNDARRLSSDPDGRSGLGSQAIADPQSRLNVVELDRLIRSRAGRAALWMTPPPVIDERISTHPSAQLAHLSWSSVELKRKAALIQDLFPEAGDTWNAYVAANDQGSLMLADGLHPSLVGQELIAELALRLLQRQGALNKRTWTPN